METPPGQGKQYWIVNEDQLRQLILDYSPEIRRDTQHMADMIAEMVKTDREKAGLDNPKGNIELRPNKDKKAPAHPDMIGEGRIAGRLYKAGAWVSGVDHLRISLLPKGRK